MADIVLESVSKRFADGTVAVRDVSLAARDGELFVLVGPSGCGKSTLLNLIAGLETVSSGEIRIGGSVVNDVDPKDRNLAMVFQSYALYPHMSVAENLAFPLKLARRPADEIARRVRETARVLGLEDLLERAPASLSGGQRQRVAMGRAIVREPRAFLMDEPLSNLDARLRVQMRAEVARLQRRFRVTTVYVTHDQTEAMTLADRLAVLREGELQQAGTPRRLYHAPANAFVASFIGSPAMNFAPAELEEGRLRLPVLECALPSRIRDRLSATPRRVVLGVRPEDLTLAPVETSDAVARLRADVDMAEWVGADLFVHFDLATRGGREWQALTSDLRIPAQGDDVRWVARVDPDAPARPGEPLDLQIDLERLHLFDETTGTSILHAPDDPDDPDDR